MRVGGAPSSDPTKMPVVSGVVLGTVQYMAPEQIEGRLVDTRADVFAFGATLYEMVTGRRAFDASSTPGRIGAIVRGETPSVLTVAPCLGQRRRDVPWRERRRVGGVNITLPGFRSR
jgi:eukaryotic-like serine/threonine-protein kinase